MEQTKLNISKLSIKQGPLYEQIRHRDGILVALPPNTEHQVGLLVNDLLLNQVYKDPKVMVMVEKAKAILDLLFRTFMKDPRILPKNTQEILKRYEELWERHNSKLARDKILPTVVGDYISGMTDKYAMDPYQQLSQPYEKAL